MITNYHTGLSDDPEMYQLSALNNLRSDEITFFETVNFGGEHKTITLTIKELETALNMYYADKDNKEVN